MIIFLCGEDTFRSRRKLNELKEKFLREVDPSGNSLTALDGATASVEKINEAVNPASLLSKKRMIIIENIFLNKGKLIFSQLAFYFKTKKTEENIIVFWDSAIDGKKLSQDRKELFKFLSKAKYTQEFKALSNTEAISWTKKEVELRGGKISREALLVFTSLLGSDLWQIDNEIDKLLNYKLSQKLALAANGRVTSIETEDIKNLVSGQFNERIFALTDAISNKNKKEAARLMEDQLGGGLGESYLLNMIVRQFRILLQIRQALDAGLTPRKIINLLKLHPFIVQKGVNQARNFSLNSLKNIFTQLTRIDYLMKSGQADAKTMLSLFLAAI
jgi:DNA polymerase-3 subunit delta